MDHTAYGRATGVRDPTEKALLVSAGRIVEDGRAVDGVLCH